MKMFKSVTFSVKLRTAKYILRSCACRIRRGLRVSEDRNIVCIHTDNYKKKKTRDNNIIILC